jgi:hypothetical protein
VLDHRRGELAHQPRVVTGVELGGEALLEQGHPQLGQPDPLDLDAGRVGPVERLTPPQRQRLP